MPTYIMQIAELKQASVVMCVGLGRPLFCNALTVNLFQSFQLLIQAIVRNEGQKFKEWKYEKGLVKIPQPLTIHDYNQFMNGVDRSNEMLSSQNASLKVNVIGGGRLCLSSY